MFSRHCVHSLLNAAGRSRVSARLWGKRAILGMRAHVHLAQRRYQNSHRDTAHSRPYSKLSRKSYALHVARRTLLNLHLRLQRSGYVILCEREGARLTYNLVNEGPCSSGAKSRMIALWACRSCPVKIVIEEAGGLGSLTRASKL